MSLTSHQVGEYAGAANRLEALAEQLAAGEITPDHAAVRLVQALELLIEVNPALPRALNDKAMEIHGKKHTSPEQITSFVQFIRNELAHGER